MTYFCFTITYNFLEITISMHTIGYFFTLRNYESDGKFKLKGLDSINFWVGGGVFLSFVGRSQLFRRTRPYCGKIWMVKY